MGCSCCAARAGCFGAELSAFHREMGDDNPGLQHRLLTPRQPLFQQGDRPKALYIVQSGSIKAFCISESGNEQVLAFHMPGDIVGLDALGVESHDSSAITLEHTSVCEFPLEMLDSIPSCRYSLYRLLSSALARDHHTIEMIAGNDAYAKLARFLIDIAQRLHRRGLSPDYLKLSMKRSEIGNYLGLAVETVSRHITRLQAEDVLRVERRAIEVLDRRRLETIAAGQQAGD